MGKSSLTDAGFVMRMWVKKLRQGQKELHSAFVDTREHNMTECQQSNCDIAQGSRIGNGREVS